MPRSAAERQVLLSALKPEALPCRPCRRFKRASYTIEAVLPGPPAAASSGSGGGEREAGGGPAGSSGQDPPGSGAAVERVRGAEAELLKRRDELRAFEAAYRQARRGPAPACSIMLHVTCCS